MTQEQLETACNIMRDKEDAKWKRSELKEVREQLNKGQVSYVIEKIARREFDDIQNKIYWPLMNAIDQRIEELDKQIELADQAFEAL